MFMITKEDFLEFCKESNFRIDKYQEKIIDHIFEDIKSQTLISIIFMPNAAGKTNLSVLLSCYFQKKWRSAIAIFTNGDERRLQLQSIG